MPFTLFKHQHGLYYQVTSGKKYISDNTRLPQPAQKGKTCWKYSFDNLRADVRIGKKIESLVRIPDNVQVEQKGDPATLLIVQQRQIEKIISSHRKQITEIDSRLMDGFTKLTDKAEEIKQKALESEANLKKPHVDPQQLVSDALYFIKAIEELDERKLQLDEKLTFIPDSQYNAEDCKKVIAICQNTLILLGYSDPLQATLDWINSIYESKFGTTIPDNLLRPSNVKELPLSKICNLYWMFLVTVAAKSYGLIVSQWHPGEGFAGLEKALESENVLVVNAYIGAPYYAEPPRKGDDLGHYETYHWPPSAKTKPYSSSHTITIVGVERVSTLHGIQNRVLYLDPNFGSNPGKKIKLFRISYEKFSKNLCENSGLRAIPPFKNSGPYAYRADIHSDMPNQLKSSYLALTKSYINSVESATNEYKQFKSHLSSTSKNRVRRVEEKIQNAKTNPEQNVSALQETVNRITSGADYKRARTGKNGLDSFLSKKLAGNHFLFTQNPAQETEKPLEKNDKQSCCVLS